MDRKGTIWSITTTIMVVIPPGETVAPTYPSTLASALAADGAGALAGAGAAAGAGAIPVGAGAIPVGAGAIPGGAGAGVLVGAGVQAGVTHVVAGVIRTMGTGTQDIPTADEDTMAGIITSIPWDQGP